jgi:hypothetical protein
MAGLSIATVDRRREKRPRCRRFAVKKNPAYRSSDMSIQEQLMGSGDSDYLDVETGWHVVVTRTATGVSYVYSDPDGGLEITGFGTASGFEDPRDTIRRYLAEREEQRQLEATGLTGPQISRRVLEMVGRLHELGYESLYLDAGMAPSGMYWRYEIGAMADGSWPSRPDTRRNTGSSPVCGSICDGGETGIAWAEPAATICELVKGFIVLYPNLLAAAVMPNLPYRRWFREMLDETAPGGVLIFHREYGPHYEHAYLAGTSSDYRKPLPPGFARAGKGQS